MFCSANSDCCARATPASTSVVPAVIAETASEAHLTRGYGVLSAIFLVFGLGLAVLALTRLVDF